MRVVVAFVLVTGCGRLNFDAGGDDDDVPPAITGLVASYTMEDDPSDGIEDRTGHGHAARCSGATCPRQVPGRHGNGVAFDGTSQFLRVSNSPELDNPNGFTVAAWVFFEQCTDICSAVAKPFGAGSDDTFNLMTQPTGMCMEWATATVQNQVACNGQRITGRWVHVIQMFDGADLTLLIDGAVAVTRSLGEPMAFDTHDLMIGSDENVGFASPRRP